MAAGAKRDVVIGGAGFAGLALAIALRQGLGESFRGDGRRSGARARAIEGPARVRHCRRGAPAVRGDRGLGRGRDEAQPILDMVVTDSKLDDAVRPTFLTFGGEVEEGEPFAHMIENRLLVDALVAKAKALGVDLRADRGQRILRIPRRRSTSRSPTAATISARLLVGADGARSLDPRAGRHRHARMELRSVGDRHARSRTSAITKAAPRSISCRRDRSRFCRSPASARRSCGPKARARPTRIVALPDDEFHDELEKRFGLHLGESK